MLEILQKSLSFIDRGTRLQAVGVIAVMIFGTALEAIGIGLVLPLVEAMANPQVLHEKKWATQIFGPITADNESQVLIWMTLGFFAAIVFKNIVLLLSYVLQARFFAKNEAILARGLFNKYLYGDYNRFLTRNSAEMINSVTALTASVYSHAMRGLVTLGVELLLVGAVAIILFVASPMITLVAVAVMTVTIGVMYAFTRLRISHWVDRNLQNRQKILQLLQQAIHSIKEVKVLARENNILLNFSRTRENMALIDARIFILGNITRLWVETITIGVIISGICYFILLGSGNDNLFSLFALFVAAAFRLIPSFNRILMALNSVRGGALPVKKLYSDMSAAGPHQFDHDDGSKLPFNTRITFENVSYSYPGTVASAVSGFDLEIRKGQAIGLVGASGAGKTTIADLLLGLLTPDSGRICIDGQDVAEHVRAWQRNLSYVPQTVYLSDDSIRRNVAFAVPDAEIDDDRVMEALRLAMLEDFVNALPQGLDTFAGDRGTRFSGGQRQRIGIARALYQNPDVLVLDEATSSLDNESEFEISAAIDNLREGMTIIIIAHRLNTLRSCDQLVFMKNGRLEDIGTFESLAAQNTSFNKLVELSRFDGAAPTATVISENSANGE